MHKSDVALPPERGAPRKASTILRREKCPELKSGKKARQEPARRKKGVAPSWNDFFSDEVGIEKGVSKPTRRDEQPSTSRRICLKAAVPLER